MNKIFIFALLAIFCSPVYADQAAYITKAQAEAAVKLISKAGTVRHYCEPCGDANYTAEKVVNVSCGSLDDSYWGVSINDTLVDLAYLYIPVSGRWTNVAMLLKIPVSDVSYFMELD